MAINMNEPSNPRRAPALEYNDRPKVTPRLRRKDRLLRSPIDSLYRIARSIGARAMLVYFAHAPSSFPREAIWRRVGYRYVFYGGYKMVARTEFGAMIECNIRDVIQRCIMFFGVWEPNLTAFLKRRLTEGDLFIDLGANVGYFTLLASRLVGETGTVIAVEAAPQIYRALEKNLARNHVQNVRAIEMAVADLPGRVCLYADDGENLGATTIIPRDDYASSTTVAANGLDEIVTLDELSRARVIKIDVEGAELPPLRTLLRLAPTLREDAEIVVELSPESLLKTGSGIDEIISAFSQAGYHAYDLQNSYLVSSYLAQRPAERPRRIRAPISEQTDVVFSRLDLEVL
jgi:FkbM family methyltransferase